MSGKMDAVLAKQQMACTVVREQQPPLHTEVGLLTCFASEAVSTSEFWTVREHMFKAQVCTLKIRTKLNPASRVKTESLGRQCL